MGSWLFLAAYTRRGTEKTYDHDDALHTTFDWIPRFCSVQDCYFLKWTEKTKQTKRQKNMLAELSTHIWRRRKCDYKKSIYAKSNRSKVFPPGSLAWSLQGAVAGMDVPPNAVNLFADKLYLPSINTREAVYMYLICIGRKIQKVGQNFNLGMD